MAAVTDAERRARSGAGGTCGWHPTVSRRRATLFRTVVLLAFAAFFLPPLGAMVAYSFRGTVPGTHSLNAWTQIVDTGPPGAIEITLELAAISAVVMLVLTACRR